MSATGIALAERGLVPLPGLRWGVRRLIGQRLRETVAGSGQAAFVNSLSSGPVALHTDAANEQHYELPPEFFELVLGPNLKYSSALWPEGVVDLAEAELRMLDTYCERAQLSDGQDILELGCGWGSLTLHMAQRYPNSAVTAVSNSVPQRRFIEARAPDNVTVITADMNDLHLETEFDRVVSIEMFEHMRNYKKLLARVRRWLRFEGRLFVHIFCHRSFAYPFETEGSDNWMGRYFFTGGLMPSFDLLRRFDDDLQVEQDWAVPGVHYSRTARAWRQNMERHKDDLLPILRTVYGRDVQRWYQRWRLFFLSCEELFGFEGGSEWFVGHYRLRPRAP